MIVDLGGKNPSALEGEAFLEGRCGEERVDGGEDGALESADAGTETSDFGEGGSGESARVVEGGGEEGEERGFDED